MTLLLGSQHLGNKLVQTSPLLNSSWCFIPQHQGRKLVGRNTSSVVHAAHHRKPAESTISNTPVCF